MKKLIIVIVLVGIIIWVAAKTIQNSRPASIPSRVQEQTNQQSTSPATVPVKVLELVSQNYFMKVKTVGTTRARQDYVLSAKINGEITYLNAEIGQWVSKGQLIAKIDPEMVEASYKQAEANYQLASKNYNRQMNLANQKLISDQQLESSEAQYKVAEASFRLAKVNLDYSRIISPIDGTIAEKNVELHNMASMGRPLVRIVNLRQIEIEVGMSEKNVARIQPGNTAKVTFTSLPGREFYAVVSRIGIQANQEAKTFPVILSIDNIDRLIKGGMIADIEINLNRIGNSIVIPYYVVEKTNTGNYVFVEKNNIACRTDIEIDEIQSDQVHVIKGLSAGDRLIIEGHKYVADLTPVEVKP